MKMDEYDIYQIHDAHSMNYSALHLVGEEKNQQQGCECNLSVWHPRRKRDMGLWSRDRTSLELQMEDDKRDVLSLSPDLAKLNPKCHMNYLFIIICNRNVNLR